MNVNYLRGQNRQKIRSHTTTKVMNKAKVKEKEKNVVKTINNQIKKKNDLIQKKIEKKAKNQHLQNPEQINLKIKKKIEPQKHINKPKTAQKLVRQKQQKKQLNNIDKQKKVKINNKSFKSSQKQKTFQQRSQQVYINQLKQELQNIHYKYEEMRDNYQKQKNKNKKLSQEIKELNFLKNLQKQQFQKQKKKITQFYQNKLLNQQKNIKKIEKQNIQLQKSEKNRRKELLLHKIKQIQQKYFNDHNGIKNQLQLIEDLQTLSNQYEDQMLNKILQIKLNEHYQRMITLIQNQDQIQQIEPDLMAFYYSLIVNRHISQGKQMNKLIQKYINWALEYYNAHVQKFYEQKIVILNNLASYYSQQKQYNKSIAFFKEILSDELKYFSIDDERTIITYNNLGCAQCEQGNLKAGINTLKMGLNKIRSNDELQKLLENNINFYRTQSKNHRN